MAKNVLKAQIGTSWANLLQDIGYIYNIPEIDYETIEEMLKDETVKSALTMYIQMVMMNFGEYTNDDPQLKDMVDRNFENLDESLESVLEELLFYKKAFGFAVGELVWEVQNGEWILKKIVPLPPKTITFKFKNKEIVGLMQTTTKKIEIPREKVIILREGTKPYGESIMQYMYRAWKFKNVMFKFWAMAMERYAVPVLIGKTTNPQKVDDLLNQLTKLWSEGVIAMTKDMEVSTLEPRNEITSSFERAIEYANILIYRALMMPQLLVSVRDVGSYSLGQVHYDIFLNATKQEAIALGNDVIDQIVTRIFEYNIGSVEDYGKFVMNSEMAMDDKVKIAKIISDLTTYGYLQPSTDEKWVREMLGLPVTEEFEEDVEKWAMNIYSESF